MEFIIYFCIYSMIFFFIVLLKNMFSGGGSSYKDKGKPYDEMSEDEKWLEAELQSEYYRKSSERDENYNYLDSNEVEEFLRKKFKQRYIDIGYTPEQFDKRLGRYFR